jgi:DNA end-binding protein Ku
MAGAIWSGSISFGMVSIPVKLYGATESKDISFHLLHATCGTRLQQRRPSRPPRRTRKVG